MQTLFFSAEKKKSRNSSANDYDVSHFFSLRVSYAPRKFFEFQFYSPETLSLPSLVPKHNEPPYHAVYCHPKYSN